MRYPSSCLGAGPLLPTNHCHLTPNDRLAESTRAYKGAVIITHDRYFLDNVTG